MSEQATLSRPRALLVVAAAGCAALLVRPWAIRDAADPTTVLFAGFVVLGTCGAMWPLPRTTPSPVPAAAGPALAIGALAFVAGRLVTSGASSPFLAQAVLLNAVAAIAEEAFFRRLVFGALERHGAAVAVAGSATLFALVHVTVWGVGVLPLDLAAGFILSWQRLVTRSWSVPAATHVLANLLGAI